MWEKLQRKRPFFFVENVARRRLGERILHRLESLREARAVFLHGCIERGRFVHHNQRLGREVEQNRRCDLRAEFRGIPIRDKSRLASHRRPGPRREVTRCRSSTSARRRNSGERHQSGALHRIRRALRVGIEGAYGFDRIAQQLDPLRLRCLRRKNIDNAAPHRVLPRHLACDVLFVSRACTRKPISSSCGIDSSRATTRARPR